jgi:predicted transcriptional regulator of viral defense system
MTTQYQQVLDLAASKGLIRPVDLASIGVHRVVLTRMLRSGQLSRVGRGSYSLPDRPVSAHTCLAQVCVRSPEALICLLSALRFHDLTTQAPFEVWVAIANKAHMPTMDYPPLSIVRFSDKSLAVGVKEYQIDGVTVRVSSIEKTIADCFKYRNKIGLDVALAALHEAYKAGKINRDRLWHYAAVCRVSNVMRPYIESIVV